MTNIPKITIAYSDRHVFFGWTGLVQPSDSVRYIWKEVNLPVSVMCIDVRQYTASNRPGAQGSKDRDHAEKVDLVLGERNGSILIYYDILRFVKDEGGRQHERNLTPRRLHWHRSSVNSVRWSKDGRSSNKNIKIETISLMNLFNERKLHHNRWP